jgi:HEAT repeat protein
VPIVPSRARRIQELLARLGSDKDAERDSAVAQLTLLGARATEPLLAALPASPPRFRRAALEVLDRLRDRRAMPEVLALAQDRDPEVSIRAIAVASAYSDPRAAGVLAKLLTGGSVDRRQAAARSLSRLHAAGLVEALEPLLDVLLDDDEEEGPRLTVLEGLLGRDGPCLDSRTLAPVLRRLGASADRNLVARAEELLRDFPRHGESRDALDEFLDRVGRPALRAEEARGLAQTLPEVDARGLERLHMALDQTRRPVAVGVLAEVLERAGTVASIPVLQRALERLGYEGARLILPEEDAAARAQAKAQVHAALAARDSRIALFDLRLMLGARPPRAVALLLRAAAAVGDGSLVPVLACLATERPAHHQACAEVFRTIAQRERLRRMSVALRAVPPAHRPALEAFWAALPGRPARRASRRDRGRA